MQTVNRDQQDMRDPAIASVVMITSGMCGHGRDRDPDRCRNRDCRSRIDAASAHASSLHALSNSLVRFRRPRTYMDAPRARRCPPVQIVWPFCERRAQSSGPAASSSISSASRAEVGSELALQGREPVIERELPAAQPLMLAGEQLLPAAGQRDRDPAPVLTSPRSAHDSAALERVEDPRGRRCSNARVVSELPDPRGGTVGEGLQQRVLRQRQGRLGSLAGRSARASDGLSKGVECGQEMLRLDVLNDLRRCARHHHSVSSWHASL